MTLSSDPVDLAAAGWTPGPEVTDLAGQPLPADARFDVPPPAEIGDVVAAWTPLRTHTAARPAWMKWLTLVALPVVFYFGVGALIDATATTPRGRHDAETMQLIGTLIVLGITAYFVFWRARRKIWYVATEGIAQADAGRPSAPLKVLRFADAAELRNGQVKHYHNGIYTGTRYHYTWFSPEAKPLLKFTGSYYAEKKARTTNNPYRFLLTSEALWNAHYLRRVVEEFEKTGAVVFHVNKNDSLRVSPERMEFFIKGEQVAIEATDIASINLAGGVFTVRNKDAKWYKRGGKYSFNYAAMSNAQVFLHVLEKLQGYRFD